MAVHPQYFMPDSLNVLAKMHDTLHVVVRDGTVLVAKISNLPQPSGPWSRTWPVLFGALVGGLATIAAQMIRAHIDRNKEREELRVNLALLVWKLEDWLERLVVATDAVGIRGGDQFWQECDGFLAGQDRTGRSLVLLPDHLGIHVWLWFNRVAQLRPHAESTMSDADRAHQQLSIGEEQREAVARDLTDLKSGAQALSAEAHGLVQGLNGAVPKGWWQKLGTGKQPFQIPGIKVAN